MEEKLLKIINNYGVSPQLRQLNEEAFELIEAVFQCERQKEICEEFCRELHIDAQKNHVAEEIADLAVMMLQFKAYYHIDGNDILRIMNEKIDRQLQRIEEEE